MRHLSPWETLPDSEAYGDRRIEMSTRRRGAGDDRKGNAYREAPADLEDTAEGCDS